MMIDYSKCCEGLVIYGVLMLFLYVYNFLFCICMGWCYFKMLYVINFDVV